MRRSSSAWASRCCSRSRTRSFRRASSNRGGAAGGSRMNMNLTLVMQAVAFFAFILFTAKVVWPPLIRAIETRQRQIAEGLQAGEQGRQSLSTAEKRIGAMLDEAKQKAAEIVAQGEKFRAETVDAARTEAQAEKDRIVASGRSEIEQELTRAKEQLRNQ